MRNLRTPYIPFCHYHRCQPFVSCVPKKVSPISGNYLHWTALLAQHQKNLNELDKKRQKKQTDNEMDDTVSSRLKNLSG